MDSGLPKGELTRVMDRLNPWWSGRQHPVPGFQRLALAACKRHLTDPSLRRAVMLSGPRRVGKSTLLNQLAAGLVKEGRDPRSVLYLSLELPQLKLFPIRDLLEAYHENVFPAGKPCFLLLDEVHYARDWDLQLKDLIDHHPEYRILATGSASVRHSAETVDSGVGRWITVSIPTLSFYEFLRVRGEDQSQIGPVPKPFTLFGGTPADFAALSAKLRPLMPLFQRYLLVGGFPETAAREDVNFCQRLLREDVVERVLKRDITTLFGVRNAAELERLFIYLCYRTGSIMNTAVCAGELGVARQTVANYLDLLERANLVYRLEPESTGGKKILKAQHKYYLVDAALRNAVLLRGEEILQDSTEMGVVAETTVLRHLYAFHYPDAPRLGYWHDSRTKKEVDIIIRSPRYTIPVEVKYRENPRVEDGDGLVRYCLSEKIERGYLVTRHDADFDLTAAADGRVSVLRIPAHIFTYLLGATEMRDGLA